jgi:chaperone BCS1
MLSELLALLKANPLVAGGMGMAITGGLVVYARSLPKQAWAVFKDQFSATVTVFSEDAAFRYVNVWLAQHPSIKHSRRLGIASWWDPRKESDEFVLTPGPGFHVLRDGLRFYLVHRTIEQSQGFSSERKQTVSITTHGRAQEPLRKLFEEIMSVREDHDTIPIYSWLGGGYSLVERRAKRPMDTIYIADDIRRDLLSDLDRFQTRRLWYADRSVPWRRGYMLKGPPGTGKSSVIFAIASLLGKPIYIVNIAALDNDNQLQAAINAAGAGILAIEDVDCLKVSETREIKVKAQQAALKAPGRGPPAVVGDVGGNTAGVTLSGLLNALDGLGSREGRITFITSNHAELLDPALIRPGRVDKQYELGFLDEPEARRMFNRFFPETPVDKLPIDIESALPISPADLQNRLLGLAEAH